MVTYLEHKDINKKKWDDCISNSYNSLIYGYSWLLDELCDDWGALVLNDYEAVMPMPLRKKFGMTYAYQPFFIQQLGVFSRVMLSGFLVRKFLAAIPPKFRYIDLLVNPEMDPEEKIQGSLSKRKNHLLYVPTVYESCSRYYNENTRRNIQKAAKQGLLSRREPNPGLVLTFYREQNADKTPEIREHHYEALSRVLQEAEKRGYVHAMTVEAEGRVLAAAIFLIDNNKRAIYLMGASNEQGKQVGAMHALVDAFIRSACGRINILDFEGSEIESIARFFKGFGAEETAYFHLKMNRLPLLLRWLK